MKVLFVIFSTILAVQAIKPISGSGSNIGQNCDFLFPTIVSVNMSANPWPPTSGVSMNQVILGTLSKDEPVGDMIITLSSGSSSTKNNVTINKLYTKNSLFNFSYTSNAPTASGTYNQKFQAMQNITQNVLMCWQISYVI